MRPRRCTILQLQLEHKQLSGNGLHRDLELSSAEVSTKPDPDGRLVRRPETRQTVDLRLFARKPQISTYLGLDHVPGHAPGSRSRAKVRTEGVVDSTWAGPWKAVGCDVAVAVGKRHPRTTLRLLGSNASRAPLRSCVYCLLSL